MATHVCKVRNLNETACVVLLVLVKLKGWIDEINIHSMNVTRFVCLACVGSRL